MVTLFTDLDDTMIYSGKVLDDPANSVMVEMLDDRSLSYMTLTTHAQMSDLHLRNDITFIPVTTRVKHQFDRICIPCFKYALISNGATLLVDGSVDADWQKESEELVKPFVDEMRSLFFVIAGSGFRNSSLHFWDNMFIQGKFENPLGVSDYIKKRIVDERYSVYMQRSKVYVIPKVLEKGKAVERFRKRFNVGFKVVSAGDNLLDFSMADYSDVFITNNKKCGVAPSSILVNDRIFSDYILEYARISADFGRI